MTALLACVWRCSRQERSLDAHDPRNPHHDDNAPDAEVVLRSLGEPLAEALNWTFAEWAHGGQVAPSGDWRTWVLMAGRGFGKTRAGAEWVLARGCGARETRMFASRWSRRRSTRRGG
jgi:hypothetical protein